MPTRRFIGGWCPGASSCDCPLILDSRMMATVCRVSRFVNMSSRRMRRSRASTCSRQWGSAASAGGPQRGGGRPHRARGAAGGGGGRGGAHKGGGPSAQAARGSRRGVGGDDAWSVDRVVRAERRARGDRRGARSEEHTSELQSQSNLV